MRDVLATHRDVSLFGLRHRTWLIVLVVLLVTQTFWMITSGGGGSSRSDSSSASLYMKKVPSKRVAIVMPLHSDVTSLLQKRFKSWNGKRFPCASVDAPSKPDIVFYVGPNGGANLPVIQETFTSSKARQCFNYVRIVNHPTVPHDARENEESYAFFRAFEISDLKQNYDVMLYMSPHVWQVQQGWSDKIYEEATLSDPFWVKGSAAMQTCPRKALTPDGDCDGSINLAFPAVVHININALYALHDVEFDALRHRAERKYGSVEADVAMFKELVSTDHPVTQKLARGQKRGSLAGGKNGEFKHHSDEPALSAARQMSHHLTSLYWPAHAHRYRYTDFIVNALAGKKHFKEDLQKGLHPNTFLVHQGISEN